MPARRLRSPEQHAVDDVRRAPSSSVAASVRVHGASRREDGRRPPRHEGRRQPTQRRPHRGTSIRAAAAAQVLPARCPEDGGVTASPPSHRGGRSAGPEGKRRLRGALVTGMLSHQIKTNTTGHHDAGYHGTRTVPQSLPPTAARRPCGAKLDSARDEVAGLCVRRRWNGVARGRG